MGLLTCRGATGDPTSMHTCTQTQGSWGPKAQSKVWGSLGKDPRSCRKASRCRSSLVTDISSFHPPPTPSASWPCPSAGLWTSPLAPAYPVLFFLSSQHCLSAGFDLSSYTVSHTSLNGKNSLRSPQHPRLSWTDQTQPPLPCNQKRRDDLTVP